MGGYIPITPDTQEDMLRAVGVSQIDDLFADVPEAVRLREALDIPNGASEMAVYRRLAALAAKDKTYDVVLRGAGAYRHYIPAAVKQIAGKEEFLTCYTPYQAEISQGVLQGIFEYQTMIAELTTMEAANASVYDGATAAGEAMAMCRERKATKVLLAANANPMVLQTMETYAYGVDAPVERIPEKDGRLDLEALKSLLADPEVCGVYLESPNYYGLIEDVKAVAELAHAAKAKVILGANPFALAYYESPQAAGVDIVVGEGQPLGLSLAYGGPYLGFMACRSKLMRRLPGRIVGETVDADGERAFVLTLQAREQHIRREKASSNICSNQAHCALTAAIYMSHMGPEGMRSVAMQCRAKAYYLAEELAELGFERVHNGAFFHEFVTTSPVATTKVCEALREAGILAGLPLGDDRLLWCVTEVATKEDLDRALAILKEVAQ